MGLAAAAAAGATAHPPHPKLSILARQTVLSGQSLKKESADVTPQPTPMT
jgi:hypothetical protein